MCSSDLHGSTPLTYILGYGGGSHDNLDRLECWSALIIAAIAIGIVLNALGIFLIRAAIAYAITKKG